MALINPFVSEEGKETKRNVCTCILHVVSGAKGSVAVEGLMSFPVRHGVPVGNRVVGR